MRSLKCASRFSLAALPAVYASYVIGLDLRGVEAVHSFASMQEGRM